MSPRNSYRFNYAWLSAALILFLLWGCSHYQYIAITDDVHQNKEQQFVIENDTAKIVYSFQGYNLPVTVQIYNKLDQPLYVDWNQSIPLAK